MKLNKREKKGVKTFIFFSLAVILIGVVMLLFEQQAFGYLGGKHTGKDGNVSLSAKAVIGVGVLMLVLLFLLVGFPKSKDTDEQ